jgi:hypothetical protein
MVMLPGSSPHCYASGSEEKVIRILEAPQAFDETLALAKGNSTGVSTTGKQVFAVDVPLAATQFVGPLSHVHLCMRMMLFCPSYLPLPQ